MKKKNLSFTLANLILVILVSCSGTEYPTTGSVLVIDPEMNSIVAPGALPEILAEGFEWSEGPLWLPGQKKVLFSDIPNNSVFEWSEQEGLKLYLKPSGYTGSRSRGGELGSNGLLLDSEGKLVLCQHGDRRMARMTAQLSEPAAEFETLAGTWDNKRFNSPNDAVFKSTGELYFTDPAYGMENRFQDTLREMDFTGVFKLDTDGKIERCFGEGHHLLRLGFIGVWIGARLHQHVHIDPILANLLHEVFLRGNADENGNGIRCPG